MRSRPLLVSKNWGYRKEAGGQLFDEGGVRVVWPISPPRVDCVHPHLARGLAVAADEGEVVLPLAHGRVHARVALVRGDEPLEQMRGVLT